MRNVLHNMEMSRAMQWMIVGQNDFSAGHFHGNQMVRKMQPEEPETDYNQSIRRLKEYLTGNRYTQRGGKQGYYTNCPLSD